MNFLPSFYLLVQNNLVGSSPAVYNIFRASSLWIKGSTVFLELTFADHVRLWENKPIPRTLWSHGSRLEWQKQIICPSKECWRSLLEWVLSEDLQLLNFKEVIKLLYPPLWKSVFQLRGLTNATPTSDKLSRWLWIEGSGWIAYAEAVSELSLFA